MQRCKTNIGTILNQSILEDGELTQEQNNIKLELVALFNADTSFLKTTNASNITSIIKKHLLNNNELIIEKTFLLYMYLTETFGPISPTLKNSKVKNDFLDTMFEHIFNSKINTDIFFKNLS